MTQRTTLRCVTSLPAILTTDILQWCSFCNDFATIIVLCTGCRVGICVRSQQVLESACLEWDEMITRPDFVFYCPYCCHSTGNTCAVGHPAIAHLQQSGFTFPQLTFRDKNKPKKDCLWFRYDPPVLIVAFTWHETKVKFGRYLQRHLAYGYQHSPGHVSVDVILEI
jgi:hypothetical protein